MGRLVTAVRVVAAARTRDVEHDAAHDMGTASLGVQAG